MCVIQLVLARTSIVTISPLCLQGTGGLCPSSRALAVLGQIELGTAKTAHDRPVLDLFGRELEATRLGLAGALDGDPPPATLGGLALAIVALVLAAGTAWASQVNQERQPGGIDPGGNVGPGVVGGL